MTRNSDIAEIADFLGHSNDSRSQWKPICDFIIHSNSHCFQVAVLSNYCFWSFDNG